MNALRNATDLHPDVQYIKDTYPLLFDRLCDVKLITPITSRSLTGLFTWKNTPEGEIFWNYVYYSKWDRVKQMFPEYFEPIEKFNFGDEVWVWDSDNEDCYEMTYVCSLFGKHLVCDSEFLDKLKDGVQNFGTLPTLFSYKNVSKEEPIDKEDTRSLKDVIKDVLECWNLAGCEADEDEKRRLAKHLKKDIKRYYKTKGK